MIGGFGIESVRERRNGATNGVTFGSLELIDIEQKHLKTKEKCEKGREKRKNGSRLAPVHQSYSRNRWIGEERINRGCFGGGLVMDYLARNNGEEGIYELAFTVKEMGF
uniref:Uncharacterized protein n=1 Tax=Solanum lycopersicum TaxID=4081 RepID=K4DG67_SOLLC